MSPRELAAAIRKGHTMIGEERRYYLNCARDCGCALGSALIGSGVATNFRDSFGYESIAKLLEIDAKLAGEISVKHFIGTPRLEIAAWLDTLEPAQRQTFESFMAATLKAVSVDSEIPASLSVK